MTPIPRDIPLPLPANQTLLEVLLVVAFLAHILFVNLMVGGSILVFGFQLRGLRDKDYDALARALATTVTVNKSLAVVLGVAPLLLINVLYTIHFYTANALTGTAWILLVPVIAATFLLLYLHKYTWDRLAAQKGVHISIMGIAVALFLGIPLVFLANVNLMMFPEHWTGVRGLLGALALPNVFPRYFHFLCASLILTSLFGVWYFGRASFPVETTFERMSRPSLRRTFYSVAFVVSLAQFVVGPLVLFTLPSKGFHTSVLTTLLVGATLAIPAVWMMWRELSVAEPHGRRLPFIVGYLSLTVLCMVVGRHLYRSVALKEHRAQMQAVTRQWVDDSAQAAHDLRTGRQREASGVSQGQELFQTTCAACHSVDRQLVGPSLTEIARLYADNPQGIVTWARAPGKKRPDAPQMPPFASLGDQRLGQIADYMLEAGAAASP
ncbi:cytochrome c [Myxococcus faecalis]|uniref:c-type cytochrome n=1 Tax=Myxococcus faecalis TaxID=3115646 RepID=UPI003CEA1E49